MRDTTGPGHGTLYDAFAFHATSDPRREALSDSDRRTWTYGGLRARAAAAGSALMRAGVRPGSRVAVIGGRTADTVSALLGVLHAGAAYCVLDPEPPTARLDSLLADLEPAAVLVAAGEWGYRVDLPVVRLDQPTPAGVAEAPAHLRPGDLAYVMYTSGSTGRPKGVLVEHGSVLAMLRSYDVLARPADRLVGSLIAPCGFDVSVWEIFSVLTRGGTLRVPGAAVLHDGRSLWEFLVDSSVTSAYVPPGLLPSLVDAAADRGNRAGLDRVLVGVEPIPQGLLDQFRDAVPGLRVVNGYGPTETTITATLHLVGPLGPRDDPARRTPIGRAVLGSAIELVDERLEPVPAGQPGEIVIYGSCLARGYHRAASGGFLTLRGRRAYRTGDYARPLRDGSLEFIGRRDSQLKINGFRVEAAEVEAALGTAPGVRRSLVLAAGEPATARLVAAVEAETGVRADVLRQHLTDHLPANMIPSRVLVVPSFPMTPNGKIDTVRLLAQDRCRPVDAPSAVPAVTDDQRRAARVWAGVLGVTEVGLDDDFHWLGGTSLDAVRISARLAKEGWPVPAAAVLAARTVRALCAVDHVSAPASTPAAPGRYPASRAHQGLWAWRQLAPADTSSTVVHAIQLDPGVDPDRMRQALAEVAARHEALRTTFHATGADAEQLEQRISPPGPVELRIIHVAGRSEIDARLRALLGRRFDVSVRSWTAELLLGEDVSALAVAADHMVFDGESAAIFEHDLGVAYERGTAGPAVPGPASDSALATPPPQRMAGLRDHWRRVLADMAAVPALPEPLERSAAKPCRRQLTRVPEAATWTAIEELARQQCTTPFVVVLAALKAFLHRRHATEDNVVCVAMSRRHAAHCPAAIGHFVNLVPVRDRLARGDESRSFRWFLAGIADRTREAIAHADLPFEDMLGFMPRPSGPSVTSPARVVLAQEAEDPDYGDEPDRAPARAWPDIPLNALYDLTVFVTEGRGRRPFRLRWVWDAAKALSGAGEHACEAFDAFLSTAVWHPDAPLADAAVLTPGEVELTRASAGTDADSRHPTILELVYRQVRARPEAVAVQQGKRLVTYAELEGRAREIHARLPAADGRGRTVAVVLEKSVDLLATLLAVLRSGAAYLPIAPEHAGTRLMDLIRRADAAACVSTASVFEAAGLRASDLDGIAVVHLDADRSATAPPPVAPVAGDDLIYVMPTSGTTGAPKLVGVPHRAVSRLVHDCATLPLYRHDRTMLIANSSFDAATFEIWGALANGGRVVVPTADELCEPMLLCAALHDHGITAGFFTVTLFERLLEADPARLAGMRHIIVGGEEVPPSLFTEAARYVRRDALVNGYGPTENTTFSCCYRLDRDPARLRSVPIGPPISGSGAVVSDESLRLLPIGVPGEILVCGAGLAHGYLNDAELTADRFVRVAALGGRLAYRTGDLGRLLPGGELEYLGRMDRQVKIRGFRVEPGEVEAALRHHPAVRRAAVYAERVAGAPTLRAAVEAIDVDGVALRSWLGGRLPGYLVPDRIIVVEAFPMTANGKLDHAALRSAAERKTGTERTEPRTEAERELTNIWADALDVPRIDISLDDDVFALGASSITVQTVVNRVRRELGWIVPSHVVYSLRTVCGLADHLHEPDPADDADLRRLRRRAALVRKSVPSTDRRTTSSEN